MSALRLNRSNLSFSVKLLEGLSAKFVARRNSSGTSTYVRLDTANLRRVAVDVSPPSL
jgi:hypothetical protein